MRFHDGSNQSRRAAAWTQTTDENGVSVEKDTLRCVHCQRHWFVVPGSGRRRGWCLKCNGPVCGRKRCMTSCYPFEKQLDDSEKPIDPGYAEISPGGLIVPKGSCPDR